MQSFQQQKKMFQPANKKFRIDNDSAPLNVFKTEIVHPEKTPKETIVHVDSSGRHLQSKRINERWCKISFGESSDGESYNLGKIELQLILSGANGSERFKLNFDNGNITQRFPGLDSFRIQVEGLSGDSKNVINLQTRREISAEDASLILDSSKIKLPSQPDHKCIEMRHFTFAFHKLNIPAALFGKPGMRVDIMERYLLMWVRASSMVIYYNTKKMFNVSLASRKT